MQTKQIHPVYIKQDTNQSLIINGRYDLTRLSAHEYSVIKQVVQSSDCKFDSNYSSLKLINNTYPIVYKPRYILLEMVVQLYDNSTRLNDILAVALAYTFKGAMFRVSAIECFETFFIKAGKMPSETNLPKFDILSEPFFSNTLSELYEKEHRYDKALFYTKHAKNHIDFDLPYYTERIAKLENLIKNPKKKRKGKCDEDFEKQVSEETTKIIMLLKEEKIL